MWKQICLTVVMAAFCLFLVLNGCGTEDLVFPGMPLPTTTVEPTATPGGCLQTGAFCTVSTDCCSNNCGTTDGITFTCF